MMRLGPFAFAIFLSILPISAIASQRQPTLVAKLEEESIPAQDLAVPSPAAAPSPAVTPSPAADTNPNSGEWIAVPPRGPPTAGSQAPISNPSSCSEPPAAPADVAPAIDVGSIATT